MYNPIWFDKIKFYPEVIETVRDVNFKRDINELKRVIEETDKFIENHSKKEITDRLYSVLKCYGKNMYERATELWLSINSRYCLQKNHDRDLYEIAKFINKDSQACDYPYNIMFIDNYKLNKFDNISSKVDKDYAMTQFAEKDDIEFIFLINSLQHGNSYLRNFIQNEEYLFDYNYNKMKDLFIQLYSVVTKLYECIDSITSPPLPLNSEEISKILINKYGEFVLKSEDN